MRDNMIYLPLLGMLFFTFMGITCCCLYDGILLYKHALFAVILSGIPVYIGIYIMYTKIKRIDNENLKIGGNIK